MKRVLVSPLSWGLGHATRDLPIIRYFLERGHHVTIAAEGRALTLLEHEVPQCDFIEFKDYPSPFTTSRHFILKFLAMMPMFQTAVNGERRKMERLLRKRKFDLILSDHRYSVRWPGIPSFIISSMLSVIAPIWMYAEGIGPKLYPIDFLLEMYNVRTMSRFDRIIVPDEADDRVHLGCRMTHWLDRFDMKRVYYAGIIANIKRLHLEEDVDVFITISGPEPQRTELEKVILAQVERLPGERIVVTCGKPETRRVRRIGDRITVYDWLSRREQVEMLNRARLVVCRSGYTTIMELAELGKKALFIPTPYQTEQEYLAWMYGRRGWFHSVSQYDLDLVRDVEKAKEMPGLPFRSDTALAVERLYRDLFAPILDG